MNRSILVPLDGSRFAEAALPIASELARTARAAIHLVHASERALVGVAGQGGAIASGEPDAAVSRDYLAEVAGQIRGRGAREVDYELVQGAPVEALQAWMVAHAPSLVVMATHGRGSLDPLGLGSVAEHLARCAPVPLLLVRPEDGARVPGQRRGVRKVLAPMDLAEGHEALVDRLAGFACLTQAHVTLLHVITPTRGLPEPAPAPFGAGQPRWPTREEAAAQRWLDGLADRLRARGVATAARVVTDADVAGTILAHGDRLRADVVALHAHGCGESHPGIIGPIVDRVVREGRTPVLILPPIRPGLDYRG